MSSSDSGHSRPRRRHGGKAPLLTERRRRVALANLGDLNTRYQIAPLFCRPWTLLGLTPGLVESHYENNYGGGFARLNAISDELEALDPATTPAHVIRRLSRTRRHC